MDMRKKSETLLNPVFAALVIGHKRLFCLVRINQVAVCLEVFQRLCMLPNQFVKS